MTLHSQAAQYTVGQHMSVHMQPHCGVLQILDSSLVPWLMLCCLYVPCKLPFVCGLLVSEPNSGPSHQFTCVHGGGGGGRVGGGV